MTIRNTHDMNPASSRAPQASASPKVDGEDRIQEKKEDLPTVTETSLAASIRLQSRLSDLAETVNLYLDFDDQTKRERNIPKDLQLDPVAWGSVERTVIQLTHEADVEQVHRELSYFYHREIKYCVFSIARALHQLEDRASEGMGVVPESLKATCTEIEAHIKEVRDTTKADDWKGLGKEKKRHTWRKHYEQLLQGLQKTCDRRRGEIDAMKTELRIGIVNWIKNDQAEKGRPE